MNQEVSGGRTPHPSLRRQLNPRFTYITRPTRIPYLFPLPQSPIRAALTAPGSPQYTRAAPPSPQKQATILLHSDRTSRLPINDRKGGTLFV